MHDLDLGSESSRPRRSSTQQQEAEVSRVAEQAIDEAIAASIPASDPPPWTSLHAGTPRRVAES